MVNMNPSSVRLVLAGLCLLAVLAAASVRADGTPAPEVRNSPYLAGQLLVASPRIGDPRFARTVIYMVSHDQDGALGLVVNKAYGSGPMEKFLKGFDRGWPDSIEPDCVSWHPDKNDALNTDVIQCSEP